MIRVIVTVAVALVVVVAAAAGTLYTLLVIDAREPVRRYYGDTRRSTRVNTGLNRDETRQ